LRILVTGADGQLGRECMLLLAGTNHEATGAGHAACDIRNFEAVRRVLSLVRPDAIVNCAAFTAVDAAESNRERAFAVNADGPRNLARAAVDTSSVLCHMSTDFVFDGTATTPIREDAQPRPINAYGESKLAGEEAVQETSGDHIIIRTSWLYGQQGPNFVLTMRRLAHERDRLRVVADQIGSPTWTGHLAPAIIRLIELEQRGTFHVSNSGAVSWHGFAATIIAESDLNVPVDAITTDEYPTPARRPRYSVLENRRWREIGEPALPHWRDGLRSYLGELSNHT
jgi:dTDP-4-dehydrorhamnose reductase